MITSAKKNAKQPSKNDENYCFNKNNYYYNSTKNVNLR